MPTTVHTFERLSRQLHATVRCVPLSLLRRFVFVELPLATMKNDEQATRNCPTNKPVVFHFFDEVAL